MQSGAQKEAFIWEQMHGKRDGKVREEDRCSQADLQRGGGDSVSAPFLQNVAARLQQEGRDQQRQRRDACAMHSSRSCHGMQE